MSQEEEKLKALFKSELSTAAEGAPDFDSMWKNSSRTKSAGTKFVWKIAASIAIISLLTMVYLRQTAVRSASATEITSWKNPTEGLMPEETGSGFEALSEWNSPTESLLTIYHTNIN